MGIESFSLAVKEGIVHVLACSLPRRWLRTIRNANQQEQRTESNEILITRTITQETTPCANSQFDFAKLGRARSPSLLVINREAEFSPSGSPTGTALGIPAEHILDENPSGMDETIQPIPFSFDNPFAGGTPPRTESIGSDNGSTLYQIARTPSDGSTRPIPPSVDSSVVSGGFGIADGNSPEGEPVNWPRGNAAEQDDDVKSQPAQWPPVQGNSYHPDICALCSEPYQRRHMRSGRICLIHRESRAWLPCGHCFGHRCLHHWMDFAYNVYNDRRLRCPYGCTPLHHSCGHLTMPMKALNQTRPCHRNPSAVSIPWDYEFCSSSRGRMLHAMVRTGISLAEMKILTTPRFMLPPGIEGDTLRETLLQQVRQSTGPERRQTRLNNMHSSWWHKQWSSNWSSGRAGEVEDM
ncbi:hypothetical protein V8C42DRAFT_59174 [Trichoderma barbatum]